MAIKDRLTKKTTKPATVKKKVRIRSGIDVLDYFEMNKDISGLYIYNDNKIFYEKNGIIQQSDEIFEFSLNDLIKVIVSKYENDFISVGDSYIIKTENGTVINILAQPYLASGSFISFKKKRIYDYSIDSLLKNQILNYDISDYLKQRLLKGENIFVAGSYETNKLPVLSYLSELSSENTAIIQGLDDILSNTSNNLIFSKKHSVPFKSLISKAFELSHNLVVSYCDNLSELMSIFEFINSGYKHFVIGFNINSRENFLENIKNNIMLNYPQMSEDKILALIASSLKTIVFLEKMKDGETRISHVTELKLNNGQIKIDDLFVFDFAKFKFISANSAAEEEKEEEVQEIVTLPVEKKQTKQKQTKDKPKEIKPPAKSNKNKPEIEKEEIAPVIEILTDSNKLETEQIIKSDKKINKYILLKEKIKKLHKKEI